MNEKNIGNDPDRIIFYRTTADGRRVRVAKQRRKPRPSNNDKKNTPELSSSSSQRKDSGRSQRPETDVYVYTICNGLSNQLLHHAAHISKARQLGYQRVAIPNHFILQGTQTSNDNVGVTKQNSVPFTHVFDAPHFLHILQTQLQLLGHFVDQTTSTTTAPALLRRTLLGWTASTSTPACLDLSQSFQGTDPVQVRILLQSAFRPSPQHMEPIVHAILQRLPTTTASNKDDQDPNDDGDLPYSDGVCLHDRNGQDWIDHCQRWSSIPDGVYRGNCLPYLPGTKEKSSSSLEFLQNLKARVFPNPPSPKAATSTAAGRPPGPQRWVYYCGDHPQIPSVLLQASASYQSNAGIRQNPLSFMSSTQPSLYTHITSRHLILQQEKERQQQPDDSAFSSNLRMNQHQHHNSTTRSPLPSLLHDLLAQQQHMLVTQYGFSNDSAVFDLHRDARDFWALLDFYVCRTLPRFVGNSVSTFSAIQIALRQPSGNYVVEQQPVEGPFLQNKSLSSTSSTTSWHSLNNRTATTPTANAHGSIVLNNKTTTINSGAAYWYNSQSIPLGSFWKTFDIPLVYTYTEQSVASGKYLLQASIASVRRHMALTPIHVLYHGHDDVEFRTWLQQAPNHLILHDHNPTWAADIEEMRVRGDVEKSHLFLHAGNYLGTWQRIDVPLFVDAEYALLLDSDTIVQAPFTLDDFGLDLTRGIAMSSETEDPGTHKTKKEPSNAGVLLMNIPFLRRTHSAFIEYIVRHKHGGGQFGRHPSPSDQGAYLTFYANHVRYLDYMFNMKPYIALPQARRRRPSELQKTKIVHFHGPKPHDYIAYMVLGGDCPKAAHHLCVQSWNEAPQSLCHALSLFAQSSLSVTYSTTVTTASLGTTSLTEMGYCQASFPSNPQHAQACQTVLQALVMASYQTERDGSYSYGIPKICTRPNKGDFARFLMASLMEDRQSENSNKLLLNDPRKSSVSSGLSSSDRRIPTNNNQPNAELLGHGAVNDQPPLIQVVGTAQSPLVTHPHYQELQRSPHRRSFTFYLMFVLLTMATVLCSSTWFCPPPRSNTRNNKSKKTAPRRRRRPRSSSPQNDDQEDQQHQQASWPPPVRFLGQVTRLHILMILCLALCLNNFWQSFELSADIANSNNSQTLQHQLQESRGYIQPLQRQEQQQQYYQVAPNPQQYQHSHSGSIERRQIPGPPGPLPHGAVDSFQELASTANNNNNTGHSRKILEQEQAHLAPSSFDDNSGKLEWRPQLS